MTNERGCEHAGLDPSPVCVEGKELEWEHVEGASDDGGAWFAQFGDLIRYEIWQAREGFEWCMTANGEVDLCEVQRCPILEAAQAACDADHERRTLELVNARSVESVRAEYAQRERMIVSHATSGSTTGEGLSVNDISLRVTELRNHIWDRANANGREERDRELEPVFAALKKHHDQALRVGSVIFPAEPDMPEPVEIDLSEAYADSSLYEETVAALALRSLTEGEG